MSSSQLAPWRPPLVRAMHRNRSQPHSRYLQLATVQVDGRPANRTVVFRGFLDNTNQLRFVTDVRSQKIEQIEQQPWGEACWYFTNTREQFRISGQLSLIHADSSESTRQKARYISWQELSEGARLQFAWPHPGHPKADTAAFTPEPPNSADPLPNFCLLLLEPVQVEHLELRGNPQNRWIYRLDDADGLSTTWLTQSVNP